ncbi:hypothetical protein LOK49_LG08G01139 [Camellia lanceoleosa]|uniref:Uncharacterized protein n=1 Tax=Camellia lanceoleosa TaxID=1840588 RepID=A0ACC0GUL6_9ERIC|nr:hypothetical protein LOK49_LG08G01139 [Camellia lanceoleosa]
MASSSSAALAEAYMMRKLHKEKMKKSLLSMERPTTTNDDHRELSREVTSHHSKTSVGFFAIFKKIHPTDASPPQPDSAREVEEEGRGAA